MKTVIETRYDLDMTDFANLDMASMQILITRSAQWQARNSRLRVERLTREAQGPQVLA